jgi:hypothetical protein
MSVSPRTRRSQEHASTPSLEHSPAPSEPSEAKTSENVSVSGHSVGYKEFCEFSASASDFFSVRRFDTLATRVILWMQYRITQVEEELGKLDDWFQNGVVEYIDNGRFEGDHHAREAQIRESLQLLDQYCTARHQIGSVRSFC